MNKKNGSRGVGPEITASVRSAGVGEVCSTLEANHLEQLALCARLEEVADDLPEVADTQMCLHLARRVLPLVKRAHEYEENTLFPLLQAAEAKGGPLAQTIERLRYEHWEDEAYADEVSDGLISFVTDRASSNPETLAYMLRGFFEGLRRHIAFEREYIVPILARAADGSTIHS